MEHIVMVPVERYLEMKCAEEKLHAAVEELRSMQTELNGVKELARIFEQLRDKKLDDPLIDDEDLNTGYVGDEEIAAALHLCSTGEQDCDECPFLEIPDCADKLMEAAADAIDRLLKR